MSLIFFRYESSGDLSAKPKTVMKRKTTAAKNAQIIELSNSDGKLNSVKIQQGLGNYKLLKSDKLKLSTFKAVHSSIICKI